MAHSVTTAWHDIGRGIFAANNQMLLLHQAVIKGDIFCCGIFFGVEKLSHRRGHVLRGFVTSPEFHHVCTK